MAQVFYECLKCKNTYINPDAIITDYNKPSKMVCPYCNEDHNNSILHNDEPDFDIEPSAYDLESE